jgi:hypothetical protein
MSRTVPKIDSYEFGKIVIDGETYTADVIIAPDGVKAQWWRKEGHSLCPEDLESVLTAGIEVVIIGCGAYSVLKVPQDTRRWVAQKGIELIALPTPAACTRYNEISASGKAVAALHLTC